jgi:glutathione S-transferase
MSLQLFAHPFSSYCQKALIALYENHTPFELHMLEDPGVSARLAEIWPVKRFPVLVDDGRIVLEATIVIEHLDVFHRGPTRFIPLEAEAALRVRMLDRVFDNYVMTPMQKIVGDRIRHEGDRDPYGVAEARSMLETAYRWLDERLRDRVWADPSGFSLADCAAAPALFYADWAHPIDAGLTALRAYRTRLLARPSVARVVDEARPFRSYFPLGAPDRD